MKSKMEVDFEKSYVTKINKTEIKIDYINSRIKIIKINDLSKEDLIKIINIAKENSLSKIIANCRLSDIKIFYTCNFELEGFMNGFFRGDDAYCLSYFVEEDRRSTKSNEEENKILLGCMEKKTNILKDKNNLFEIRTLNETDIYQMIELFKITFKTYPTPIFSKSYLKSIINETTLFRGAFKDEILISIVSAELDRENLNSEITDCATNPEFRGLGLAGIMISDLEKKLKKDGFKSLYSISRAINFGINAALYKNKFEFTGRLKNNCDICGGFENMNIWVKKI